MPAWLDMPHSFWGIVLYQFVAAMLLYYVLAGLSHLVMVTFKRAADFPGRASEKGQTLRAMKWAAISLAGNALLSAPFQYQVQNGRSAVYHDVAERGVPYLVGSIVLYLLITETMIYWIHRALHHRLLYKHIHFYHHQFRVPTPWASLSFHPLDSFAQGLPHFLCALVIPVHIAVYTGFVVFVTVWAITIHDRTSILRWPVINYTGHHTLHHLQNKWNYGQFFTFWDRIGGTYRSPREMEAKARVVTSPSLSGG